MSLVNTIGENIRKLMDKNSVTAVDMARELDISRQTLLNYLKGSSIIDSVKLVEVANFFNVSVNELLDDKSSPSTILFRTALNYEDATTNEFERVKVSIDNYWRLAKKCAVKTTYFPEQYNLTVTINDSPLDINYECNDYYSNKLKMTNELEKEIESIANEQRKKIGAYGASALTSISMLEKSGVNILFINFLNDTTSGLSCVDDEKGCFIFVNSNETISLERRIFTVFHEYAHILLHRSLYKRKIFNAENNSRSFLDKMADTFAGYFLIPKESLIKYNQILNSLTSYQQLYPIKHELQVSLSSLVMALKNHGYINYNVVNNYFRYLENTDSAKTEREPLINYSNIKDQLVQIVNAKIKNIIQFAYIQNMVTNEEIKTILWLNDDEMDLYINQLGKYKATYSLDSIIESFIQESK